MRMKEMGKKLLALLLCLCMAAGMLPAASRPAHATEPVDGVLEIYNFTDLLGAAELSRGASANSVYKYVLEADITLTQDDLNLLSQANESHLTFGKADDTTVAGDVTGSVPFTGEFDGQGHTITGLYYHGNANIEMRTGLFSLTRGAYIHDLVLDGADLHADSLSGILIGEAYSTKVENVTVRNSRMQVNPSDNVLVLITDGGVIGGGLIGYASGCTVYNCEVRNTHVGVNSTEAVAAIAGKGLYLGGLVGAADASTTIEYSRVVGGNVLNRYESAVGAVGGFTVYAGGVAGLLEDGSKIIDCFATNAVSFFAATYVGVAAGCSGKAGGIAARVNKSNNVDARCEITRCHFAGTLASYQYNNLLLGIPVQISHDLNRSGLVETYKAANCDVTGSFFRRASTVGPDNGKDANILGNSTATAEYDKLDDAAYQTRAFWESKDYDFTGTTRRSSAYSTDHTNKWVMYYTEENGVTVGWPVHGNSLAGALDYPGAGSLSLERAVEGGLNEAAVTTADPYQFAVMGFYTWENAAQFTVTPNPGYRAVDWYRMPGITVPGLPQRQHVYFETVFADNGNKLADSAVTEDPDNVFTVTGICNNDLYIVRMEAQVVFHDVEGAVAQDTDWLAYGASLPACTPAGGTGNLIGWTTRDNDGKGWDAITSAQLSALKQDGDFYETGDAVTQTLSLYPIYANLLLNVHATVEGHDDAVPETRTGVAQAEVVDADGTAVLQLHSLKSGGPDEDCTEPLPQGYQFLGWYSNGHRLSTNRVFPLTGADLTAQQTYEARFRYQVEYWVDNPNDDSTHFKDNTLYGERWYSYGEGFNPIQEPEFFQCIFQRWYDAADPAKTALTGENKITAPMKAQALYTNKPGTQAGKILLTTDFPGAVTITASTAVAGTKATVTTTVANAHYHYHFYTWECSSRFFPSKAGVGVSGEEVTFTGLSAAEQFHYTAHASADVVFHLVDPTGAEPTTVQTVTRSYQEQVLLSHDEATVHTYSHAHSGTLDESFTHPVSAASPVPSYPGYCFVGWVDLAAISAAETRYLYDADAEHYLSSSVARARAYVLDDTALVTQPMTEIYPVYVKYNITTRTNVIDADGMNTPAAPVFDAADLVGEAPTLTVLVADAAAVSDDPADGHYDLQYVTVTCDGKEIGRIQAGEMGNQGTNKVFTWPGEGDPALEPGRHYVITAHYLPYVLVFHQSADQSLVITRYADQTFGVSPMADWHRDETLETEGGLTCKKALEKSIFLGWSGTRPANEKFHNIPYSKVNVDIVCVPYKNVPGTLVTESREFWPVYSPYSVTMGPVNPNERDWLVRSEDATRLTTEEEPGEDEYFVGWRDEDGRTVSTSPDYEIVGANLFTTGELTPHFASVYHVVYHDAAGQEFLSYDLREEEDGGLALINSSDVDGQRVDFALHVEAFTTMEQAVAPNQRFEDWTYFDGAAWVDFEDFKYTKIFNDGSGDAYLIRSGHTLDLYPVIWSVTTAAKGVNVTSTAALSERYTDSTPEFTLTLPAGSAQAGDTVTVTVRRSTWTLDGSGKAGVSYQPAKDIAVNAAVSGTAFKGSAATDAAGVAAFQLEDTAAKVEYQIIAHDLSGAVIATATRTILEGKGDGITLASSGVAATAANNLNVKPQWLCRVGTTWKNYEEVSASLVIPQSSGTGESLLTKAGEHEVHLYPLLWTVTVTDPDAPVSCTAVTPDRAANKVDVVLATNPLYTKPSLKVTVTENSWTADGTKSAALPVAGAAVSVRDNVDTGRGTAAGTTGDDGVALITIPGVTYQVVYHKLDGSEARTVILTAGNAADTALRYSGLDRDAALTALGLTANQTFVGWGRFREGVWQDENRFMTSRLLPAAGHDSLMDLEHRSLHLYPTIWTLTAPAGSTVSAVTGEAPKADVVLVSGDPGDTVTVTLTRSVWTSPSTPTQAGIPDIPVTARVGDTKITGSGTTNADGLAAITLADTYKRYYVQFHAVDGSVLPATLTLREGGDEGKTLGGHFAAQVDAATAALGLGDNQHLRQWTRWNGSAWGDYASYSTYPIIPTPGKASLLTADGTDTLHLYPVVWSYTVTAPEDAPAGALDGVSTTVNSATGAIQLDLPAGYPAFSVTVGVKRSAWTWTGEAQPTLQTPSGITVTGKVGTGGVAQALTASDGTATLSFGVLTVKAVDLTWAENPAVGTASHTPTGVQPVATQMTLTATPETGYTLLGWYRVSVHGEEKVLEKLTLEDGHKYLLAGKRTVYALFGKDEARQIAHAYGDDTMTSPTDTQLAMGPYAGDKTTVTAQFYLDDSGDPQTRWVIQLKDNITGGLDLSGVDTGGDPITLDLDGHTITGTAGTVPGGNGGDGLTTAPGQVITVQGPGSILGGNGGKGADGVSGDGAPGGQGGSGVSGGATLTVTPGVVISGGDGGDGGKGDTGYNGGLGGQGGTGLSVPTTATPDSKGTVSDGQDGLPGQGSKVYLIGKKVDLSWKKLTAPEVSVTVTPAEATTTGIMAGDVTILPASTDPYITVGLYQPDLDARCMKKLTLTNDTFTLSETTQMYALFVNGTRAKDICELLGGSDTAADPAVQAIGPYGTSKVQVEELFPLDDQDNPYTVCKITLLSDITDGLDLSGIDTTLTGAPIVLDMNGHTITGTHGTAGGDGGNGLTVGVRQRVHIQGTGSIYGGNGAGGVGDHPNGGHGGLGVLVGSESSLTAENTVDIYGGNGGDGANGTSAYPAGGAGGVGGQAASEPGTLPKLHPGTDGDDGTPIYRVRTAVTPASPALGTLTADKTFAASGDTVTLTATPNKGCDLVSLTADPDTAVLTGNVLTMPAQDVTVTAAFQRHNYNISTVNDTAKGTVTVPAKAQYGDTVAVRVNNQNGYEVESVTVTGKTDSAEVIPVTAGTVNYTFSMPAQDVEVAVTYREVQYTIQVSSDHGTVVISSQADGTHAPITQDHLNDIVDVQITPQPGYRVDTVTVTQTNRTTVATHVDAPGQEYDFTMPASNVTVTVTYKAIDYTIQVTADNTQGSVTTTPSTTANVGQTVDVNVVAAAGYALDTITVRDTTNNADVTVTGTRFTMPAGNVTVTVTFQAETYTITVAKTTGGTVEVQSPASKTAKEDDTVTFRVTPDSGYEMDEPTVAAADHTPVVCTPVTGQSGVYTFTMPAKNVTITVHFRATATLTVKAVDLTWQVSPAAGSVSVAPGATQDVGTVLTLTPAAEDGYVFIGWFRIAGAAGARTVEKVTLTGNQYTLTADATLYALFADADAAKTVAQAVDGVGPGAGDEAIGPYTVDGGHVTVQADFVIDEGDEDPHTQWIIRLKEDVPDGLDLTTIPDDAPIVLDLDSHTVTGTDGDDTAPEGKPGLVIGNGQDVTVKGPGAIIGGDGADGAPGETGGTGGDGVTTGENTTLHVTDGADIRGGDGGKGGDPTDGSPAGEGGDGGKGIDSADNTNTTIVIDQGSTVTGGNGGDGGQGGDGGNGGDGVTGDVAQNDGTIRGGRGGDGGEPTLDDDNTPPPDGGDGGNGVTGDVAQNDGTITGGDGGDGGTGGRGGDGVTGDVDQDDGDIQDGTDGAADPGAPALYTITVSADASKGTVTTDPAGKAKAGATVTVTATAKSGYKLSTITVTDADGGAVTVKNGVFTMPAQNVTVTVTFASSGGGTGPVGPGVPGGPVGPGGPGGPGETGETGDTGDTPAKEFFNTEDHGAYVFGYPDGTVGPLNYITRSEVVALFYRMLNASTQATWQSDVNVFEDVPADAWYYTEVCTLRNMGIITGRTLTQFAPTANITRAEFATIAARFIRGAYQGPDQFDDIADSWARNYINAAAAAGWVVGDGNGTFRPNDNITRAETVTILNRMLGRLPRSIDDLHADMVTWPDNADPGAWYYIAIQEATNSHEYTKQTGWEVWTRVK